MCAQIMVKAGHPSLAGYAAGRHPVLQAKSHEKCSGDRRGRTHIRTVPVPSDWHSPECGPSLPPELGPFSLRPGCAEAPYKTKLVPHKIMISASQGDKPKIQNARGLS